jgi:hypothetical protein
MTPESRQRRIAYLRKLAAKRKTFTFGRGNTDRALIHRQIQSAYCLLIYFGFAIYRGIQRDWFREDAKLISGYLYPIGILAFTAFLIRFVIKSRWAIKVLDEARVGNIYELPESDAR